MGSKVMPYKTFRFVQISTGHVIDVRGKTLKGALSTLRKHEPEWRQFQLWDEPEVQEFIKSMAVGVTQ